MRRPLYKAIAQQPADRGDDGHAGLWFDKFCNQWRIDGRDPHHGAPQRRSGGCGEQRSWTMKTRPGGGENESPKLNWIRTLAGSAVGTQEQIGESALRLMCLIHRRGGRAAVFTSDARFVTGLGRSHPVENGFAWHPTLGTPYLPGSSVKGMVRAWAKTDADPPPDRTALEHLLGKDGEAGRVCFLDAVPMAPVKLEADVMTPHYAGWSDDDPPGDWRSPKPIPFLTAAAGASFLFGLVPRRSATPEQLDTLSVWLRDALEWAGAGAKTAVGYGRFRYNEERTRDWRQRVRDEDDRRREARERQEAMKSPEGRWRSTLQGMSEEKVLDRVRMHLGKEPLEDPREKRAFARAIPTEWIQQWRKGRKQDPQTGVGKKKLKERAALVDEVLAGSDSTPAV